MDILVNTVSLVHELASGLLVQARTRRVGGRRGRSVLIPSASVVSFSSTLGPTVGAGVLPRERDFVRDLADLTGSGISMTFGPAVLPRRRSIGSVERVPAVPRGGRVLGGLLLGTGTKRGSTT